MDPAGELTALPQTHWLLFLAIFEHCWLTTESWKTVIMKKNMHRFYVVYKRYLQSCFSCNYKVKATPTFLLVGCNDGPGEIPAACQIWIRWLQLLLKYQGICFSTTNSLFEPPFGGVRGNVRTSSIAHWKARSRLPIRDNWTFFASSYGWCTNTSKSSLLKWWVNLELNIRFKVYVFRQHILYTVR